MAVHHAGIFSSGAIRDRRVDKSAHAVGIPGWQDLAAILLVLGVVILVGVGAREMVAPFVVGRQTEISLSPLALPLYTLSTIMRMLAALVASLFFTFTYATAAARSRRAEVVLIPILDVLQSVPILGYLSFTVLFFVSLFPGNVLGPELAAIFAIFTSQAWNMAFSFYESLRTIPTDLDEASRSFRSSAWQRFWRLEVPFAMPGLVWNMMMSMSGGWFFVVASEAISVGDLQIALPGVGSYVARAIQERDLVAVGWAILGMTIAILLYDQLLFRPMVAWAEKFRFEQTAAQIAPRSWVLDLFRRSLLLRRIGEPIREGLQEVARARFALPGKALTKSWSLPAGVVDFVWHGLLIAGIGYIAWEVVRLAGSKLSWSDFWTAVSNGGLTLLRVMILVLLASLVWVPIGVAVGLRPKLTEWVQPIAQFLAAFPANLLFPVTVFLIVRFSLSPGICLTPLMILGTQWYILVNVIAGASVFPNVKERITNTGIIPSTASADDGYSTQQGRDEVLGLGLKVVSISGAKGKKIIEPQQWKSEPYRQARADRSAMESLVFTLKEGFEFGQMLRRTHNNVLAEMLEKVLAYNISQIIRVRNKLSEREETQRAAA